MSEDVWAPLLIGVSVGGTLVFLLGWIATSALRGPERRLSDVGRRAGSGVVGGIDAVFAPSAYDAHAEWEARRRLPVPAPAPDRGDAGDEIRDGRITIRL